MNKLTPEQLKQLEQLKDIHLPEPISWWPLAIGWWIVFALLVIVIVSFVLWSRRESRLVKKDALAELASLESDNPTVFSTNLSALLKRVAMYRDLSLESLSGQAWSDYLQANDFSKEQANFIANAPYAKGQECSDVDALKRTAAKWIHQQFKRGAK